MPVRCYWIAGRPDSGLGVGVTSCPTYLLNGTSVSTFGVLLSSHCPDTGEVPGVHGLER